MSVFKRNTLTKRAIVYHRYFPQWASHAPGIPALQGWVPMVVVWELAKEFTSPDHEAFNDQVAAMGELLNEKLSGRVIEVQVVIGKTIMGVRLIIERIEDAKIIQDFWLEE